MGGGKGCWRQAGDQEPYYGDTQGSEAESLS